MKPILYDGDIVRIVDTIHKSDDLFYSADRGIVISIVTSLPDHYRVAILDECLPYKRVALYPQRLLKVIE